MLSESGLDGLARCTLEGCSQHEALGLPANLSSLELTIFWSSGDDPSAAVDLNLRNSLEARAWPEKFTRLDIRGGLFLAGHKAVAGIHFGMASLGCSVLQE